MLLVEQTAMTGSNQRYVFGLELERNVIELAVVVDVLLLFLRLILYSGGWAISTYALN
jgi:hypothetical protein